MGTTRFIVPAKRSIAAVAAAVMLMIAGCSSAGGPSIPNPIGGAPSGPGPEKTEAKLQQLAATSSRPVYYLGAEFNGWPLDDAVIFSGGSEAVGDNSLDSGQVLGIGYGTYCSGDTCGSKFQVTIESVPLTDAVGCSRLQTRRGVPTVRFGDDVLLFTGDYAVHLAAGSPPDLKLAEEAVDALRKVGEPASGGADLPAPDAAAIPLIDAACGRHPGEHGPELPDGPQEPQVSALPDFTVPRLGGGQLRWADYVGKPVVIVAGDVTHVAPAIRHLAQLTDGGRSPAVIGLIWDTFGDKQQPAPIKDIEQKAGKLPVPAGYPATYPAVWLSDTAAISPAESGVIAFIDRTGVPLSLIRSDASDASDADIRAGLKRLH